MDDVVNRMARELSDAIAAALAEDAQVEAVPRARAGRGIRDEAVARGHHRIREPYAAGRDHARGRAAAESR